jgi:hypothetical protein
VRSEAVVLTGSRTRTRDFVALAKPRLNFLVVASALAGYVMAGSEGLGALRLIGTLIGTGLVAGGASAFNQVLERDVDLLMRRTRLRPLPDQRLLPMEGSLFGAAMSVTGLFVLAAAANLVAATVALVTLVTYVAVYTPLKRRTSLGTVIGAFPGAFPRSSDGRRQGATSRRKRGRSSASSFSGSCRTSSRSRGSIATITRGPASRCCRSSSRTGAAPGGSRCSMRRRSCR